MKPENSKSQETWEKEILTHHRWGKFGQKAEQELEKLHIIWKRIQPISDNTNKIMNQVISTEICNWKLEESILAICKAIGMNTPVAIGIGHMNSITNERWKKIWAYFATLKNWLVKDDKKIGYRNLLEMYDLENKIQKHILSFFARKKNKIKRIAYRTFLSFPGIHH